jgi:hypothetical protein
LTIIAITLIDCKIAAFFWQSHLDISFLPTTGFPHPSAVSAHHARWNFSHAVDDVFEVLQIFDFDHDIDVRLTVASLPSKTKCGRTLYLKAPPRYVTPKN